MRRPMLRKCQPGPRVMFPASIPRRAARVRMQLFSTAKRVAGRNIAPGDAVRGTREAAHLAHDAQQIGRKAIAHLGRGARGPAEIGIEAVAALLFEDQREDLLFQISLLVEIALRIVLCQARIGGLEALVQLHQRLPARRSPAPRIRRSCETRMQRSTRARCSQRSA